jgi:hypothetical protein
MSMQSDGRSEDNHACRRAHTSRTKDTPPLTGERQGSNHEESRGKAQRSCHSLTAVVAAPLHVFAHIWLVVRELGQRCSQVRLMGFRKQGLCLRSQDFAARSVRTKELGWDIFLLGRQPALCKARFARLQLLR